MSCSRNLVDALAEHEEREIEVEETAAARSVGVQNAVDPAVER